MVFEFCDGAAARLSIAGLYLVLQPKGALLGAGTMGRGACSIFMLFFLLFPWFV
jgi:hypothetical protein